ncbi:MAG: hypothetical protein H6935_05900 [Thiobacillus sp.]|nr:hypothetical protein [Thiobacillus sp.]
MSLSERLYHTVGRHFVTLSCLQHAPQLKKPKLLIFSGFLVDVDDVWFYVTAGHILTDVSAALQSGASFDVWRLGDNSAGNRFMGMAIPYHFDIENWIVINDPEKGLDYAAVPLTDLYCLSLSAGGASPIGTNAWGTHLDETDGWALVGIPSESIEYDEQTLIKARVIVAPLKSAPPPHNAEEKAENQFYARFADDPTNFVEDIDGMSGGPIFSLRKHEGQWKYWVIGVQSAWYRESGLLVACPFSSFGAALADVVAEAKRIHVGLHGG